MMWVVGALAAFGALCLANLALLGIVAAVAHWSHRGPCPRCGQLEGENTRLRGLLAAELRKTAAGGA